MIYEAHHMDKGVSYCVCADAPVKLICWLNDLLHTSHT